MRQPTSSHNFAKALRDHLSLPEKLVWVRLRRREPGCPVFRRQHPVGRYVLDFYCARARLGVEIDGQGHGFGDRPARDAAKDAFLREQGIDVLRMSAGYVLRDPETAVEWMIEEARVRISARAPSV